MPDTNLRLSEEERRLLMNREFILTKQRVLGKAEQLLGAVSTVFREVVRVEGMDQLAVFQISPKIAKGENYKQYPWLMLDYPRLFTSSDVCAIRCFFWWGHYGSITLQLSGYYLEKYKTALYAFVQTQQADEHGWLWYMGNDLWEHEIREDVYIPLSEALIRDGWNERGFIKLTKKIPLEQWDSLDIFWTDQFRSLLSILVEKN